MDQSSNRLEPLIAIPAIALLAVFVIPRSALVLTDLAWPLVSAIDPDRVFMRYTIHHLLQLAFTLIAMKFVFRLDLRQAGFNLDQWRVSLKIFWRFAPLYFGLVVFARLPNIVSGIAPSFGYPLTPTNVGGMLGFQFLLVGIGEEPLFRGLVMIALAKYMSGMHRIGSWELPTSGIVATGLFMLAHVGFTFSPFEITHFSPLQQLTALGLGLYYAMVFHRTGSLLGPIISHNFSDGIIFVVLYSMAFWFG